MEEQEDKSDIGKDHDHMRHPELSGSSKTGNRGNELPWYVIDRSTELGMLVTRYRELDEKQRERIMGYLEALRVPDENA